MTDFIFPTPYHNPVQLNQDLHVKPEAHWTSFGEHRALTLFHQMVQRVPAYKKFLQEHHIDPTAIKTIQDFSSLPSVDKDNYLRKYPLEQLCWDGDLKKTNWTISATSGSTGAPFYFPRQKEQDLQYAATAELYLLNNFHIDTQSTLYIDGFGMGVWIGGVFTYQAIRLVAERGNYPLSVITPGSSKEEIIKAVEYLGHKFDQIIIAGYPPLVKDTIDDGITKGISWKKYNLKFIFSAEGFSEYFRDYIIEKTGLRNPYVDTLNHYGTVDLGTMSHETPLSILIRRSASNNTSLYQTLFPDARNIPTLTQFDPGLFYFESVNNRLYCTAASGLPLIRYDLKDQGRVISLDTMHQLCAQHNVDLDELITKHHLQQYIYNLPFVYVYERADFTVKLSGANIYADEVRRALQKKEFDNCISGKFLMQIQFDDNQDQYLEIHIELKNHMTSTDALGQKIVQSIVDELLFSNSEYHYLYQHLPLTRLMPRITFWPYEDPTYFRVGGKQKWVGKK